MINLLKMDRYQLQHNLFYWYGMAGVFLLGFFTADTYLSEVMGPSGGAAASLEDILDGMVYDSTFLLILVSTLLSVILGQEFSSRTVGLEISAGHSRKSVFVSKAVVYLAAFHFMTFIYPVAGCIREYPRFGIARPGDFFCHALKAFSYSVLLNSAVFLLTICVCCWSKSMKKAVGVTAGTVFVLRLYLGYGMMLGFPVAFLPIYQIRVVVSTPQLWQPEGILVGVVWAGVFFLMAWKIFKKSDFR